MKSYMEKIAEMFGLKLNERFECSNGHEYAFTNKGVKAVYNYPVKPEYEDERRCDAILMMLLSGEFTILPKPYKPFMNEIYWYTDGHHIYNNVWSSSVSDWNFYKLENCYRTAEDAEKDKDKWAKFYSLDEVLKIRRCF